MLRKAGYSGVFVRNERLPGITNVLKGHETLSCSRSLGILFGSSPQSREAKQRSFPRSGAEPSGPWIPTLRGSFSHDSNPHAFYKGRCPTPPDHQARPQPPTPQHLGATCAVGSQPSPKSLRHDPALPTISRWRRVVSCTYRGHASTYLRPPKNLYVTAARGRWINTSPDQCSN